MIPSGWSRYTSRSEKHHPKHIMVPKVRYQVSSHPGRTGFALDSHQQAPPTEDFPSLSEHKTVSVEGEKNTTNFLMASKLGTTACSFSGELIVDNLACLFRNRIPSWIQPWYI